MILAQAYETNLDRLRRYAAFSCGSQGLGDGVVNDALMDLLGEVSSAEAENRIALFQKLEASLRDALPCEAGLFAQLGRWRMLSAMERRVLLLQVIEGFSIEEVARITGLTHSDVTCSLGRARMIYADRFPARVGLIGGDASTCEAIENAIGPLGYRLHWAVAPDDAGDGTPLPPVSAVVIAHDVADVQAALTRCEGHTGPLLLAQQGVEEDRPSTQCWTLPKEGLGDAMLFNSTLIRALLFSD